MVGKIFVSYRRDDDPNGAARVRDGLAATFGKANVFMDVDNLIAGQRFDEELAKALAQCDVLVAVVGARWMELLKARRTGGEFDYVREEIAEALSRKLVVIPVRVGREGSMPPVPRIDELPRNIREIVLHQKHDVTHERFGRDIAELIDAIATIRRTHRPPRFAPRASWGWIAAATVSVVAIGYAGAYYAGVPLPWPGATMATERIEHPARAKTVSEVEAKRKAEEAERQRLAALEAEERERQKNAAREREAEAERRRQREAEVEAQRRKAEDEERSRVEAERRRIALLKESQRKDPYAPPGWVNLDCKDVGFARVERDDFSAGKDLLKAVRLYVTLADVQVSGVRVIYADGEEQNIAPNLSVREGERSRTWFLSDKHVVSRVEVAYQASRKPARACLEGLQ